MSSSDDSLSSGPEISPEVNPEISPDASHSADSDAAPAGGVVVVGIGGSAGALDAYERFFTGLPLGSRMALVVVSHLVRSTRA